MTAVLLIKLEGWRFSETMVSKRTKVIIVAFLAGSEGLSGMKQSITNGSLW